MIACCLYTRENFIFDIIQIDILFCISADATPLDFIIIYIFIFITSILSTVVDLIFKCWTKCSLSEIDFAHYINVYITTVKFVASIIQIFCFVIYFIF